MLQREVDLTADFTATQNVRVDASGCDWVLVQIVTPSAQINFNASNDAGAIVGITDGNALSSQNFQPAGVENTANRAVVNSTITSGIFRYNVTGRFLQIVAAAGTTISKLLVSYNRIH